MNKSMTRAFQGKKENGTWEQFEWDGAEEPTLEETGYVEIEEISADSRMDA